MKALSAHFNLGLFWLSTVLNNARCGCPYATVTRIPVSDNKISSWPSILGDIQNRRWVLEECEGICVLSSGLKEIIVSEITKGSCVRTLEEFLIPEEAQDTSTTHGLQLSERSNMIRFGLSRGKEGGEGLVFEATNKYLYFDDEKEEARKSIPITRVQFNIQVDHLVVPSEVFEAFESSKKKKLSLQLPFGISIKVSKANVHPVNKANVKVHPVNEANAEMHQVNKANVKVHPVNEANVEVHQNDHYVFGKAVLKHLQYMVEEREDEGQTVWLGPLEKRTIREQMRTFLQSIPAPKFINTQRRPITADQVDIYVEESLPPPRGPIAALLPPPGFEPVHTWSEHMCTIRWGPPTGALGYLLLTPHVEFPNAIPVLYYNRMDNNVVGRIVAKKQPQAHTRNILALNFDSIT
ncbi:unnamed protein product [Albugo candida]|uniref:Uncharacterized protein n=1 Tax=Albugo candida TaxID=65357 RepID=A0A024FXD6_9STRA|nr:unnamed protein product [Albugo candida]|eukprot:CCI11324.1 unnamed protein product [Albugo candida]